MMRFLFLRFFTPLWILSFGLGPFPAHALRPMSDQSGLEEKLHSAAGLEAVGRSRPEDDGMETPGRERDESSFFRNLEMDLPEEWRKKLTQRRGSNDRVFPPWLRELNEGEATRLLSLLLDLKEGSPHQGEGVGILRREAIQRIDSFFSRNRNSFTDPASERQQVAEFIVSQPDLALSLLRAWIAQWDLPPEAKGRFTLAHENPNAEPIPKVAGSIPVPVSAAAETFQPLSPLLLPGGGAVPEDELERQKRFVAWAQEEEGIESNTYQGSLGRVVARYLPRVTSWARKIAKTIPGRVDLDDLISAGRIGLLEAASRYDPARGTRFDTYVVHRILGAILDELRDVDLEGRAVRRLVKNIEKEGGTGFSVEETAAAWRVDPDTARRALEVIRDGGTLSLEGLLGSEREGKRGKAAFPDQSVLDPSEEAEQDDLLYFMTRGLTPREKVILILRYQEGLTDQEAGDVLGVSESRVAQIWSSLHEKMGKRAEQFREGKTLMRLDSPGSRFRYARLALGLSRQEAGKKAGIGVKMLSGYELSQWHPREENLRKLSAAYQVPPEWFLKGESPPEFLAERYLVRGREEVRRIEEERGRKGIPPSLLAQQAGVVRTAYSFYVRGEVVPTPPVLERLRQAIETSDPWYQPPRYIQKRHLLPKGGRLEEKVSNALAALAQTAQRRPGVLVIEAPVLSRRSGLEEFAARVPRELGRKILLYAEEESLAARETAARSGIRFVRGGMEELAAALIGLEEADQVGFLGDPGKAKLLSQVLPASMAVTPLDPGTGLEELLLLLGMPREFLPELDATGLEEDLARQRAA